MAYAVPARLGARQGAWPRRVGGAVATGMVLAAMAVVWWRSGSLLMGSRPPGGEPLRLSLLPLPVPTPAPTPTPAPPPKTAVRRPHRPAPGKPGGGHRSGPRASEPVRPVPPRPAGGAPIVVVPRIDAPPLVSSPVEMPAVAAATPSGASGAAPAGPGSDAGSGTGSGTGRGSGSGPGNGSGEVVYTKPDWIVLPSDSAIRPYWPPVKSGVHTSGASALACRVRLSTRVHGCVVIAESPAGSGFGRASVDASRIFRIRPPRRDGRPVDDAWVLVTIRWKALSSTAKKAVPPGATAATSANLDQPIVGVVH